MRFACSPGQSGATLTAVAWADVANLRGGIVCWAPEIGPLGGGRRIHPFNAA